MTADRCIYLHSSFDTNSTVHYTLANQYKLYANQSVQYIYIWLNFLSFCCFVFGPIIQDRFCNRNKKPCHQECCSEILIVHSQCDLLTKFFSGIRAEYAQNIRSLGFLSYSCAREDWVTTITCYAVINVFSYGNLGHDFIQKIVIFFHFVWWVN